MPREIELQEDTFSIGILLNILKLPPNALKVLLYLYAQGCLETHFLLSSKELCAACNISRVTYSAAFNTLVELNYLQEQKPNYYILNMKGGN